MTRHLTSPVPREELSIYRDHCIALLRRYFLMSVEVGRLPAILGREIFTTRAEDYHVCSFEDTVLFVIDIERCLDLLAPIDKKLIAYIVLQEYTREETAALLGCTRMTVYNHFDDALDSLSAILLDRGLMRARPRPCRRAIPACAGGADRPALPDNPKLLPPAGPVAQFVPALLPAEKLSSPPAGAI